VTAGGVAVHAEPLAHVLRKGVVESVHHGHLLAAEANGVAVVALGDSGVTFFPRSSLKPLQAVGMLRAGLDLPGELLALAAASHSGEPAHLQGVVRMLDGAGLCEDDLQNTPGLPLDPDVAARWRVENRPWTHLARTARSSTARCSPRVSRPAGTSLGTATPRIPCSARSPLPSSS
jgi:L-asparaginase II